MVKKTHPASSLKSSTFRPACPFCSLCCFSSLGFPTCSITHRKGNEGRLFQYPAGTRHVTWPADWWVWPSSRFCLAALAGNSGDTLAPRDSLSLRSSSGESFCAVEVAPWASRARPSGVVAAGGGPMPRLPAGRARPAFRSASRTRPRTLRIFLDERLELRGGHPQVLEQLGIHIALTDLLLGFVDLAHAPKLASSLLGQSASLGNLPHCPR